VRDEVPDLLTEEELVAIRVAVVVFVERADTLGVLVCIEVLVGVIDMRGVAVGTADCVDVLVEVDVRVSKVATSAKSL
jgi:hypothetical protein